MAKYQQDRFAVAAAAYAAEFGVVPTANAAGTAEGVKVAQANAAALAARLGEAHDAFAGLQAVATLRASIARRFIRLSVVPAAAAAAKASKPRRSRKAA